MNWLNGVTPYKDSKNLADSIEVEGRPPQPSFFEGSGGAVVDGMKKMSMKMALPVQELGDNINASVRGDSQEQIDQTTTDRENNFAAKIKPLEADPNSVGMAGQILNPLTDMVGRTVMGVAVGGPLVGGAFAGGPEFKSTKAVAKSEGIDESTATKKGLIAGSVLGVGATIPAAHFVKNFIGDFSLSVGVNAGLGVAERAGTKELLSRNGYDLQAKQYEAFDKTALTIDSILGAAFFGVARIPGARTAIDAALVKNKDNDAAIDTAPGVAVDGKSQKIHQDTLKKTIAQLARGEPVNVDKGIQDATFLRGPRGIRNNNPGNIENTGVKWQGIVEGNDPRFASFDTPQHGIRALSKNLLTYQDKHGLDTVEEIINRWAPPNENDTGSYVNVVAKAAGVSRETKVNLRDPETLEKITTAIIKHENGKQPYKGDVIKEGVNSALYGVPIEGAGNVVRTRLADKPELPDDFVESVANRYEVAAEMKQTFDADINTIMKEAGIKADAIIPDSLKDIDRSVEKIMSDYKGDASRIKDINRATIVIDDFGQADRVLAAASARYGTVNGVRNGLNPDMPAARDDGYRDMKMNVDLGSGETAEIQVNFPQMIEAKKEAHKKYKVIREIEAKIMLEDRHPKAAESKALIEARNQMVKIYDSAWDDVISASNSSRDISVPLRSADSMLNRRGSTESQASTLYAGDLDTGTPSTSRNFVPFGNDGRSINSTPFDESIQNNPIRRNSINDNEEINAFSDAYGDSEFIELMANSNDQYVKNVVDGLSRAAPAVSKLRRLIGDGSRLDMDIAPDLVAAVREFSAMRAKGLSIEDYLAQQGELDIPMTPEINNLLIGLQEASSSPQQVADLIDDFTKMVDDLGDPNTINEAPLKQDVIADSVEAQRKVNEPAPEMQAAHRVADLNPDMKYTMDDGREVTAKEALAIADDAVSEAEVDANAFNAAVLCFNRTG